MIITQDATIYVLDDDGNRTWVVRNNSIYLPTEDDD